MNTFTKVVVVLVLLLSAAFAATQMMLYAKRVNWREKYEVTDAKLTEKTKVAVELNDNLQATIRERDDIKARKDSEIARLKEDLGTRDLEIARLGREKERLQDIWTQERTRVTNLEERLDAKDGEIQELRTRGQELADSLKNYMTETEKLEQLNAEKDSKIGALDKQVAQLEKEKKQAIQRGDELDTIMANLEKKGFHFDREPVPVIDAVLARVDNGLGAVVLNKGKNDQVTPNLTFTVYRGKQFIARVYVMEVYEGHSLARVDRSLEYLPMEVGDNATTRIQ